MTTAEQNKICRVVVHQARHLIAKGAEGTWSSAFVKMSCEKEKFMTSVADKSLNPQWNEDCEFNIKEDSCLEFLVYHRGKVLDDFLGRVAIPLGELQAQGSTAASTKWYKLQHRPAKAKKDNKERGDIEISLEVLDEHPEITADAGVDLDGSEVRGQVESGKGKRASSLRAKTPGLKSKLKVPRLKSYVAVNKDENISLENNFTGREKSDSNDSGRASDSFASESPTSVKRLSHNAQGNFGSLESVGSCGSHSKEKKGGLKKRMKSAIGSLKRDKTHSKDSLAQSPYSSASSLPSQFPDTQPQTPREMQADASPPSPSPSSPSPWACAPHQGSVVLRNRTASASELNAPAAPKATRPLSYPLRAISEEHIPLEALYSHNDPHRWRQGDRPSQQPETDQEHAEHSLSKENKLRHSFRSGLPSLRKSNVSVTFDPATENGYGTGCKEVQKDVKLPAQYVKMTKEELIRRLLLKERLLRERHLYIRELEDYTDNLLLKVMLESPRLLDRDFLPRGIRPTR